jgi:hypothetical protein
LENLKEKIDNPEDPKRRLYNDLRFWTFKLLTEGLLAVSRQDSKGLCGSERLRSEIFARSARAREKGHLCDAAR